MIGDVPESAGELARNAGLGCLLVLFYAAFMGLAIGGLLSLLEAVFGLN